VFPRVNLPAFLGLAPGFLLRRKFAEEKVRRLRAAKLELTSDSPAAFELDGEWAGKLPVTFAVERQKLRVVVP
jgi:diacylglycerol kinase family enzyme